MLKWLAELRGSRTQAEMAKEIGIAQSTYASIEIGIRHPSVPMAKKIAEVMGFPWARFFE